MYRAIIIVVTLLAASTTRANDWVSKDVAAAAVQRFFATQKVWAFSPGPEHPHYVALSPEDCAKAAKISVGSVRSGGDNIFRCWHARHGFADAADGSGTLLLLCYECRRGAFLKNDDFTWFTIGPEAEADLNALFRKYGLVGSEVAPNQRARANAHHPSFSAMTATLETPSSIPVSVAHR